jgi:hypothetical protein
LSPAQHTTCLQEMAGVRPPARSCRAGAVVHLQALNGSKVPMRLAIKTVEHAMPDRVECMHIVQVCLCVSA